MCIVFNCCVILTVSMIMTLKHLIFPEQKNIFLIAINYIRQPKNHNIETHYFD